MRRNGNRPIVGHGELAIRLSKALGFGEERLLRRFDLHVCVDEAVTCDGEIDTGKATVEFEEFVSEEQMRAVTAVMELELQGGWLIAADWLAENGFDEAANALREVHK